MTKQKTRIESALEFMEYGGSPASVPDTSEIWINVLAPAAYDFIHHYLGEYQFMLDICNIVHKRGRVLTKKQLNAVLNCMWRHHVKPRDYVDLTTITTASEQRRIDGVLRTRTPDGYYYVDDRPFKLWITQDNIQGAQLAYFQDWPLARWVPFAKVYGDYYEVFHAFKHRMGTQTTLKKLLSGSQAQHSVWAQDYTNKTGRCSYCNTPVLRHVPWEEQHPHCVQKRGWYTMADESIWTEDHAVDDGYGSRDET